MNTEDQILELIRTVVTKARNSEDFTDVMIRIREEIELIKRDERKRLKPQILTVISKPLSDIEKGLNDLLDAPK